MLRREQNWGKMEEDMIARYKGNVTKERKMNTKLSKKYGDGTIDLEKGVFMSSKKSNLSSKLSNSLISASILTAKNKKLVFSEFANSLTIST